MKYVILILMLTSHAYASYDAEGCQSVSKAVNARMPIGSGTFQFTSVNCQDKAYNINVSINSKNKYAALKMATEEVGKMKCSSDAWLVVDTMKIYFWTDEGLLSMIIFNRSDCQ